MTVCAVIRMHQVLRDSVGMMAVGVEVRREDSIAEEGASAVTSMAGTTNAKDASKQLGDVRHAPQLQCASPGADDSIYQDKQAMLRTFYCTWVPSGTQTRSPAQHIDVACQHRSPRTDLWFQLACNLLTHTSPDML